MATVCYSRHVHLLDLFHDVLDGLPVWFAVVRAGCLVYTNGGGRVWMVDTRLIAYVWPETLTQ